MLLYIHLFVIILPLTLVYSNAVTFNESLTSNIEKENRSMILSDENDTFELFGKCFSQPDLLNCMKNQLIIMFDNAIDNNKTWALNDHISINPNPNFKRHNDNSNSKLRNVHVTTIMDKLGEFLRSRRIEMKSDLMPPEEGRKKKRKQTNGALMISGLVMAAIFAQLVLGKVALVAAAALVLAKIALFVSTTSSLKKHVAPEAVIGGGGGGGGGGGSSTQHVVYTDHSSDHGGSYGSNSHSLHDGYQRSMYYNSWPKRQYEFDENMDENDEENDELKNRHIELDGVK